MNLRAKGQGSTEASGLKVKFRAKGRLEGENGDSKRPIEAKGESKGQGLRVKGYRNKIDRGDIQGQRSA